jgi:mannose-6-phosphate isomerase-like protein (cupin superfamily)
MIEEASKVWFASLIKDLWERLHPTAPVAQFPVPAVLKRDWGKETIGVPCGNYTLKCIDMKKGKKGGFQFHHRKDEGGMVERGKLLVEYIDEKGKEHSVICGGGSAFRFPQGSIHRAEALTDVRYYEASTPYLNDRCHVESEYGKGEETGGLPSTRPEDVEVIPGGVFEWIETLRKLAK